MQEIYSLVTWEALREWCIRVAVDRRDEYVEEGYGDDGVEEQPIQRENLENICEECGCFSFTLDDVVGDDDDKHEHNDLYYEDQVEYDEEDTDTPWIQNRVDLKVLDDILEVGQPRRREQKWEVRVYAIINLYNEHIKILVVWFQSRLGVCRGRWSTLNFEGVHAWAHRSNSWPYFQLSPTSIHRRTLYDCSWSFLIW